ncbi:hypothetical protein [Serratia nevei]|uniref:hypothetical protein n=1 Tax=Serratia nevei TaxID=2703794 RepID=UPI003F7D9255
MKKEELKDLINIALSLKSKDEERININRKIIQEVGCFDSHKRYEIYLKYQTESSMCIRKPSRAFPFSELKHVCSNKYLKQLQEKLKGE